LPGMSGSVDLGVDGMRNALYLLSVYSDTNGNLDNYVNLQVSDKGVVSIKN